MADEKDQEETETESAEGEVSSDEAQGDPDQLDEAEGVVPDELHPESHAYAEAEDGVHGRIHETETVEPARDDRPAEHAAQIVFPL